MIKLTKNRKHICSSFREDRSERDDNGAAVDEEEEAIEHSSYDAPLPRDSGVRVLVTQSVHVRLENVSNLVYVLFHRFERLQVGRGRRWHEGAGCRAAVLARVPAPPGRRTITDHDAVVHRCFG